MAFLLYEGTVTLSNHLFIWIWLHSWCVFSKPIFKRKFITWFAFRFFKLGIDRYERCKWFFKIGSRISFYVWLFFISIYM